MHAIYRSLVRDAMLQQSMEKMPQSKEQIGEWSVVEKFMAPKNPANGPEDGMFVSDNIVFVCDGVTSQTDEKIDGRTPGQYAVDAAIAALKSPAGRAVNSDSVVSFLTKHVHLALEKARDQGAHIPGHPSFVFAAFFPKENKLVRIRDCSYLVDGTGNNPGFLADIDKKKMMEEMLAEKERELGKEFSPEEREAFLEEIKPDAREWQWQFRNSEKPSPYRYAVIDGTRVPSDLVEFIDVPPDAKEIVLASDGYPADILAPTLEETHFRYREALESGKKVVIDDLTYLRLRRR